MLSSPEILFLSQVALVLTSHTVKHDGGGCISLKTTRPVVIVRKKRPAASSATPSPSPAPRKARTKTSLHKSTAPSVQKPTAPQPVTPNQLTSKQRQSQAYQALLAGFRERWPRLFPADVRQIKPLALGIHKALIEALPDSKPWQIRQALRVWQRSGKGAYWRAILNGGPRYTLDGTPEGEVSEKEQAHAREQLAAIRAWQKATQEERLAEERRK
jgi:hypothetical protein